MAMLCYAMLCYADESVWCPLDTCGSSMDQFDQTSPDVPDVHGAMKEDFFARVGFSLSERVVSCHSFIDWERRSLSHPIDITALDAA